MEDKDYEEHDEALEVEKEEAPKPRESALDKAVKAVEKELGSKPDGHIFVMKLRQWMDT